jgi:hypothetical protein
MTDRSDSSHSGSESISSPSMSNNTARAGPVPPEETPGGYGAAGSPSPGGYGGAGSPPVIRGGLGGIVPPRLTLLIGGHSRRLG